MLNQQRDYSGVLLSCIEWLKIEATRIEYIYRHAPGRTRLIKRVIMKDPGYDARHVDALCDQAIDAILSNDRVSTREALVTLQRDISEPMTKNVGEGGPEYNAYLDQLTRIVCGSRPSNVKRNQLIRLWFDMIHGWRSKRSLGVPSVPDLSKFMIIEWVFTIGLVIAGVIVPTLTSKTGGIYLTVPTALFLAMMGANACGGLLKIRDLQFFVYYWVVIGLGIIPVILLQHEISRWLLWSWAGGSIVGVLIGNHLAYNRSRRMATKYGPLACLWARHVTKDTYEFLMVTSEGALAWHYRVKGWCRHIDSLLGSNLSWDYRCRVRKFGFESEPCGGWFPCYPGLVATRMVGLRRRNPVDWWEAQRNTPGLTNDVAEEFFNHPPSPLGPPQALHNSPAIDLPRGKSIPW